MDRHDAAIYRSLFPRGEARFWGSRAVVDPRITPSEVARRTGISRSAVRSRLKAWRDIGFLRGYEVWPNPTLFGVSVGVLDLPLSEIHEVDRTFDQLKLVPGVLSARSLVDETGRTLRAHVVNEGGPELAQRERLIRQLTGVSRAVVAQPFWVPSVTETLSRLDWRIVAHYRKCPESAVSDAASALMVSPRTLLNHRDRLVESGALWWMLDTNSARFPVAAIYAKLSDRLEYSRARRALEQAMPAWIPCEAGGFGFSPEESMGYVAGLAFVDSPAAVSDIVRFTLSVPGVVSVRARVPHDFQSYPQWLDRATHARLVERPAPAPTRRRHSRPPAAWSAYAGIAAANPTYKVSISMPMVSADPGNDVPSRIGLRADSSTMASVGVSSTGPPVSSARKRSRGFPVREK